MNTHRNAYGAHLAMVEYAEAAAPRIGVTFDHPARNAQRIQRQRRSVARALSSLRAIFKAKG